MFIWSDLDKKLIVYSIYRKYNLQGDLIPVTSYHKRLSRCIRSLAPIIVKAHFTPNVPKNEIVIGGSYCSDADQVGKKSITIDCYYAKKYKNISITSSKLFNLACLISDVILHEIIHMKQYRKRNFQVIPTYISTVKQNHLREEQNYLGHKDEIDAYSFNIACELLIKFKDDNLRIIDFLDGKIRCHTNKMPCLRLYIKTFKNDWNHPVMVRLKKQIKKNLGNAKIGKPYKTNDWLNF